jgi:hypothetical protein
MNAPQVVQNCRAVRGDHVWVQWLGYPERRSCWRSVSTHLAASSQSTPERIQGRHARLIVCELNGEPPEPTSVLIGRVPLGLGVTASQPRTAGLPKPLKRPKLPRKQSNGEARKKKKRRGVYEVHVHKIRVESGGVKEIREVRTMGKGSAAEKDATAASSRDSPAIGTSGSAATTDTATAADGIQSTVASAASSGGGDSQPSSSTASTASGMVRRDERSELWAEHRKLNSALWNRPLGSCFRIEVTEHTILAVSATPVSCAH